MTKNCWNSQALAEISCYLAFAGAMLYLVRSGRYLSYVTPKLAPYLCFSAAVMVVWALSSLGRMFRIQYRKHIAHCFVLAIPLLLLLLPHDGQTFKIRFDRQPIKMQWLLCSPSLHLDQPAIAQCPRVAAVVVMIVG